MVVAFSIGLNWESCLYSWPASLETPVLVPGHNGKHYRVEAVAFLVLELEGHYHPREVGIGAVLETCLLL